jgi:hypothetical protein
METFSSVGTVTMLWLDDPVFESWQGQQFFLFSGPAVGLTQRPVQREPGGSFLGVKRPVFQVDHRYLVPRLRMSGALPLLPLYAFIASTGTFPTLLSLLLHHHYHNHLLYN